MLRVKRKGDSESSRHKSRNDKSKNKFGPGGSLAPGLAFLRWLLQSDRKTLNRKKAFVKNPLFPSAFGHDKTLKLCQNDVVINTTIRPFPLIPNYPRSLLVQNPSTRTGSRYQWGIDKEEWKESMRPSPEVMPTLTNEAHTEVGLLMLASAPATGFVRRRGVRGGGRSGRKVEEGILGAIFKVSQCES